MPSRTRWSRCGRDGHQAADRGLRRFEEELLARLRGQLVPHNRAGMIDQLLRRREDAPKPGTVNPPGYEAGAVGREEAATHVAQLGDLRAPGHIPNADRLVRRRSD